MPRDQNDFGTRAHIPGYDGYKFSTDGTIYSFRGRNGLSIRVIKPTAVRFKDDRRKNFVYLQVTIYDNAGIKLTRSVKDLMWMAFKGAIPEGFHIHLKDGDPTNVALSNLETRPGRREE
jgi:hypothetical protein